MSDPIRTCVGCRRTDRRDALLRVVRSRSDGAVALDLRARMPGRGAWLHRDRGCWQGARAGLSRGLRTSVSEHDLATMRAALSNGAHQDEPRRDDRARLNETTTTDLARDLLGAAASDSGLLRRDAVDNATRSKA